jgi:hypothetical protein
LNNEPESTSLFNPRATVRVEAFPGGRSCLVIDDALLEPERLVQFAVEWQGRFQPVDFSKYPGVYLDTPGDVDAALGERVMQHARRRLDARRCLDAHVRLSMVTLPPAALRPRQWFCHVDNALLPPGEVMVASVLYLFRDEGLGGTGFYEPARPQSDMEALWHAADTLPAETFSRQFGFQPGYQDGANDYFRCIGQVPARWNRLIIYDGGMLHAAGIPAAARLSADPQAGRLTLNGFFTCRRHLA